MYYSSGTAFATIETRRIPLTQKEFGEGVDPCSKNYDGQLQRKVDKYFGSARDLWCYTNVRRNIGTFLVSVVTSSQHYRSSRLWPMTSWYCKD